MTPRHLDDLFSAAYEDELSPADQTRFESHMQACEPCATAYEEFKGGIAALRELPQARMPHAVHLPSTLPVAERIARPTIGLSWFNLGLLRRFPATAVAGAVAIVLVIIAIRAGAGGTLSTASNPVAGVASGVSTPQSDHSTAGEASCTQPTSIIGSTPPVSYAVESRATDPTNPSFHLVLAAPTQVVEAGATVLVYAELSVPGSSVANPGSGATPPARALLPCLTVVAANSAPALEILRPTSENAPAAGSSATSLAAGAPTYQLSESGPMYSFVVPRGLAKGTQIHLISTIQGGFAAPGSPPLTVELTLTIG